MRILTLALAFFWTHTALFAQEMPLRVQAVQLLELSNKASLISGAPNLRMDAAYQAYGLDGNRTEGAFHRILTKDGQWSESIAAGLHVVAVFTKAQILQSTYVPPPAEMTEALSLLPVKLVRFDDSDVIQSVEDANLLGRKAKCIRFETMVGKSAERNEACVDSERGTLLRLQIGKSTIENSEYFQVAGIWFPREIRHFLDGRLRMEIQQDASVLDGPVDLMALAPPNPTVLHRCANFRRAIAKSVPQPPNAGSGPWLDIEVRAVIYGDGKVHEPTVLPQGNPDLESEAIKLVSTWEFDPPTCDGKPTSEITRLLVHFPPR